MSDPIPESERSEINGLGDLVEKVIDAAGSLVGHSFNKKSCGCAKRKNALNRILDWSPAKRESKHIRPISKIPINKGGGPNEDPPPLRTID